MIILVLSFASAGQYQIIQNQVTSDYDHKRSSIFMVISAAAFLCSAVLCLQHIYWQNDDVFSFWLVFHLFSCVFLSCSALTSLGRRMSKKLTTPFVTLTISNWSFRFCEASWDKEKSLALRHSECSIYL